MAYIGKSPTGTGVRQRYYFTATGGETSLSGTDDNGLTLSYTDGAYVDVLLNGIELVAGTDYNTSTANTIAGLAALAASDVVTVTVYDIFTVADTVSAKDGGTFSGNVVFNGNTTGLDLNGTEMVLDADGDTSITADTDDQIDFKTGGSDRVTIDASGNVGIGTTSPTQRLSVKGTNSDAGGQGGADVTMDVYDNSTGGIDVGGAIGFRGNDGTNSNVMFGEVSGRKENSTSGNYASYMAFKTRANAGNLTERMRIDSSGRMLVGVTGTFYTDAVLQVKQSNTSSGNNACIAVQNMNASGGSGVYTIAFVNSTGGLNGTISNTSSSTSYNTSSDYRLKENDVDMTGAIERVKQLQPKRFNFIADADTTVDGFMAHEVQTVVPEAITGTHNEVDDDGNPVYQGIDQSKLVPLLTGALQEAIAKIEALEARVEALETA